MAGPLDRAFVEIIPDFDKFPAAVKKGVAQASRSIENDLTASLRKVESNAARTADNIENSLDGIRPDDIDLNVDVDRRQVDNEVDRAVRAASPPKIPVNIDVDREGTFGRFISSITGVKLPIAGFGILAAAMASAAATAAQLAAALAPSVGILAGLPSAAGVAAAGITTLKVATLGVSDAFSVAATGSATEFSEAMQDLPPNVQAAAQAIRDMRPELEGLRDSVQGAFFQDFDDVLNQLADTLLGPVSAGMTAVAEQMNGIIVGLTTVATSATGVDFVNQSFAIMAEILAQIQQPLAMLFDSLLSVGTAINEAFGADAGAGLAGLITNFAAFLEQAAASGAAVQWINDALAVFQAIGDILSPIVGIFGSIGDAATATGGNILGVWGAALQVFDDFLNSAEGQSALVGIFEALNTVGDAFRSVLAGIAPALPPIISGIGSILGVVAPLLGPLSQLVGSVLTALAPILTVVAAAIQPIIGPLSTIVELLGGVLVQAIDAVMPLITVLGDVIGGVLGAAIEALSPILTVLLEALSPIIEALTPLFDLLGVVADIIGAVLAPIIQVLGDILLWLVDNIIVPFVVPVIELLADILTGLLSSAIEYMVTKFQEAGVGLQIVFNFLSDAFGAAVDTMITIFDFLADSFKNGWDLINNSVFKPIKDGITIVKTAISLQIDTIKTKFSALVDNLKGIPGKVKSALSGMWDGILSGFKSVINSVISGWNNLSFTIPSVNIPGIGSVGGATISTPNIPYLASGALATGPTLAMVGEGRFPEAVLPLGDSRVDNLLASALGRASDMSKQRIGVQAATSSASARSGDTNLRVFIGDRELTDIVVEKIDESNENMLRRARAGTGRAR